MSCAPKPVTRYCGKRERNASSPGEKYSSVKTWDLRPQERITQNASHVIDIRRGREYAVCRLRRGACPKISPASSPSSCVAGRRVTNKPSPLWCRWSTEICGVLLTTSSNWNGRITPRSEEHTSELQSLRHLV